MRFDTHIIEGTSLFHSKEDVLRAKDFIEDVKGDNNILWVLRGGYGSAKLIDYLYKIKKPHDEKIIIGYSDITALHIFLSQEWGWKSIHGAMVAELLDNSKNINNFRKIYDILHNNKGSSIELYALNTIKLKHELSGKIIGGNTAIIQNSIGTKWQIKTKNKILFLEGFGQGYQIDRVLNHFNDVGLFKGIKAVIFGEFYQPGDDYIDYALKLFAKKVKFPVFKTNQIGHGANNFPIVINSQAQISSLGNNKFNLITKLND